MFFEDNEEVLPLVTCVDGRYDTSAETLQWLRSSKLPICSIACAGKYRTGKSFLLNRLADSQSNSGFNVGDSVQACTKGLWVYKKFFPGPNSTNIVFIDTEGIDALDANDTHDVRIFTLALLLSSSFIYNSTGAIDETALQTLNLMTKVVEKIKVDEKNEHDLSSHMPRFYWILRDFSLRLVDKDGSPLTNEEYLEQALRTTDRSKCHIRDALRNAFKDRRLITLPRPVNDDSNIHRLEDRLFSMTPKFKTALNTFRDQLFGEIVPMQSENVPVNGKMFAALVEHFAQLIGTDAVPVIKDSWSLMNDIHCRDLADQVAKEFSQWLSKSPLLSECALREDTRAKQEELLLRYDGVCGNVELRDALIERMNADLSLHAQQLSARRKEQIFESLTELHDVVMNRPENMIQVIVAHKQKFEATSEEALVKWQVALADRLLSSWLQCAFDALTRNHAALCDDQKSKLEAFERDLRHLQDVHEQALRDKTFELERVETELSSLKQENDELLQASQHIHTSAVEFPDRAEGVCDDEAESEDSSDEHNLTTEFERRVSEWSSKQAAYEERVALLTDEVHRREKDFEYAQNQLANMTRLKDQLEAKYKEGMESLQVEARDNINKLKQLHEEKMNECVRELKEKTATCEDLKEKVRGLVLTNEHVREMMERESSKYETQLKANSVQLEQSNSKVLEIHKSMINDIRSRDEKMREHQLRTHKTQLEMQNKLTENAREIETVRHDNKILKRKIGELEQIETQSKSMRNAIQEKDLLIAKCSTETLQLKNNIRDSNSERERLRNENLSLESELAVLRAEKKLWDARSSFSTE